ncbi:TPA: Flp family type IVb pilin [bacterium]|nr:Flp family type IVb pilin [bacterium]
MDKKGESIVEYGLIIGLIAVIIIAVVLALGPQIKVLIKGPEIKVPEPGTVTETIGTPTETIGPEIPTE